MDSSCVASGVFTSGFRIGLQTSLAAAFFIIAPRLVTANAANRPPIVVAILFPAIVFGIGAIEPQRILQEEDGARWNPVCG